MLDNADSNEASGQHNEADYQLFLDSMADQQAEDEYWELRYRELQNQVPAEMELNEEEGF